ncbi:MAG: molecular chaperone DnaJ [candidate division Zixibacteria bacterium]|nr:molecular chaperone DnaJ [candidate division Zixibacteria bacterium]
MARDYYQILGVDEKADKDEIKKKYRVLAKKYHPDRNKGDKASEDKFKEISAAYDTLKDDKKRQQYDMIRRYGGDPRMGGSGFPGGGFPGRGFPGGGGFRSNGNIDINDMFGSGGMGDIFSALFGDNVRSRTRQRNRQPNQPRKGRSLKIDMDITPEQSANGVKKKIRIMLPEECDTCNGSGYKKGGGSRACTRCHGTGQVSFAQGGFAISRPCPSCLGRGVEQRQMCDRCKGTGAIKKRKTIAVKIPAGIEDTGTVRLRGLGYPGKNGGSKGDLIIKVSIMGDQKFAREDKNIKTSVDISFPQAALGTKVPVQTLTKKVMLNIPAGTQPGTKMRLKGAGIKVGDEQGDLLVTVNIVVPKDLTDRQKELLEEFEELSKQAA